MANEVRCQGSQGILDEVEVKENQSAVLIQKIYRGHAVRHADRPISRGIKDEITVDEDAPKTENSVTAVFVEESSGPLVDQSATKGIPTTESSRNSSGIKAPKVKTSRSVVATRSKRTAKLPRKKEESVQNLEEPHRDSSLLVFDVSTDNLDLINTSTGATNLHGVSPEEIAANVEIIARLRAENQHIQAELKSLSATLSTELRKQDEISGAESIELSQVTRKLPSKGVFHRLLNKNSPMKRNPRSKRTKSDTEMNEAVFAVESSIEECFGELDLLMKENASIKHQVASQISAESFAMIKNEIKEKSLRIRELCKEKKIRVLLTKRQESAILEKEISDEMKAKKSMLIEKLRVARAELRSYHHPYEEGAVHTSVMGNEGEIQTQLGSKANAQREHLLLRKLQDENQHLRNEMRKIDRVRVEKSHAKRYARSPRRPARAPKNTRFQKTQRSLKNAKIIRLYNRERETRPAFGKPSSHKDQGICSLENTIHILEEYQQRIKAQQKALGAKKELHQHGHEAQLLEMQNKMDQIDQNSARVKAEYGALQRILQEGVEKWPEIRKFAALRQHLVSMGSTAVPIKAKHTLKKDKTPKFKEKVPLKKMGVHPESLETRISSGKPKLSERKQEENRGPVKISKITESADFGHSDPSLTENDIRQALEDHSDSDSDNKKLDLRIYNSQNMAKPQGQLVGGSSSIRECLDDEDSHELENVEDSRAKNFQAAIRLVEDWTSTAIRNVSST